MKKMKQKNLLVIVIMSWFFLLVILALPSVSVATDGDKLWSHDGIPVTHAIYDQGHVRVTTDNGGGAIIVWHDKRNGDWDIYAQRLDSEGDPLWTLDGIVVASGTDKQISPEISPDGAGGAIIAWWNLDYVGGTFTTWRVFAQRIDANGVAQWAANGVPVSTNVGITPTIIDLNPVSIDFDMSDGAFISFETATAARAVHVNGNGVLLGPGVNGVDLGGAVVIDGGPVITHDDDGGAIAVWALAGSRDIVAQRVASDLNLPWGTTPRHIGTGLRGNDSPPEIAPDRSGGAIITWARQGANTQIVTQRIDANGNSLWTSGGVVLVDSGVVGGSSVAWETYDLIPVVAADVTGGAFIVWNDWRNESGGGGNDDIYGQLVDSNGTPQWDAGGISLHPFPGGSQRRPQIVSDGADGAVVTFHDKGLGSWDIFAIGLRPSGRVWHSYVYYGDVIPSEGDQMFPQIVFDGTGPDPAGAIIGWVDDREDSAYWGTDIYAQKIEVARPPSLWEVGPPGSGHLFTSIQAAINASVDGNEVLVHDGTYVENINFNGKAITVRSENGPESTIIDGNASGSGVTFESGEGADSVLDGFTIQNGSFTGGIACTSGSSPTITKCIISGNTAEFFGGGIWCYQGSSPSITDCIITGNNAPVAGGGIFCWQDCTPAITNCIISENTTDDGGGGIYFEDCGASSPEVINCTISGNNALRGGAVHCSSCSPNIINCTIFENGADYNGGGIYCTYSSEPTIFNCTITENLADVNGGGIYCTLSSSPTVVNSILWGDTAGGNPNEIVLIGDSLINVTYSDIEGTYTGTGNINAVPDFVDPVNRDFHLNHLSPCINSGTTNGAPEYDFEGDPRLNSVGGDNLPDMGADEVTEFILKVGPGYHYTSIQAAIDDASDGYTVLVHDGTYLEKINFKGKAITVVSENGAENTIIDGNADGSVISFTQGEGADSVLDGFTLRNGSETSGGGIRCYNSSPTILNCTVVENTATYLQGGGIYCYNASPTITNCIIARNRTENTGALCGGGGIGCYNSSSPVLTNCTIYGNTTVAQGGAIICTFSSATIVNSILWGNSADGSLDQIYLYSGGSIDISYSNVQQESGAYPGVGNINANPVFENPASNNFHLLPGSPCIDTGSNTAFGLPPRDFEGDIRILDGDDDGTPTVDMGVDEFTKKPDLIVESIVINPVCPKPYEPYTVYVTIRNRGTKNIPGLFPYLPFQCAFNSGSKPFSLWQTWNVFGLDAGESTTKQFNFPDGRAADSYTLGAIANYGNKVAESDENNNYSTVPLIVDFEAFENIFDTADATMWFGGDDRVGTKPRNIGVGQSFTPQWGCHVNSVGFRFSGRFDYYQNPTGQGHEVTLVLNTISENGTIIETEEKTVSAGFNGGWINFDLTANLEAGKKYIFTCYLKDGELIEYSTDVRGHTEDLLSSSMGYSEQISVYGGDMEDWSNWGLHSWDFNFRISGIYSNICEGDFDEDGDVDGSDLAVFAADFGRTDCDSGLECEGDFDHDNDVDGSDLAVFAADFGRTDCPH